jgi:hypothetical protein
VTVGCSGGVLLLYMRVARRGYPTSSSEVAGTRR